MSGQCDYHRVESADSSTSATSAMATSPASDTATSNSAATTMTDSIGSGGVMALVFRGFHSRSPSHRRSRERNRTHSHSHVFDQGGLLGVGLGDLTPNIDIRLSSADGVIDDMPLSGNEDISYQSYDELDAADGHVDDSSEKHHRRHKRTSILQALHRLNTKIQCTKEYIREEQTSRDDNVNEFLKLATNADKHQLTRIKAVFEKKNQKSAHSIARLQKKLESYTKRVEELKTQQYQNKSQHLLPRQVLKGVGQSLRNVRITRLKDLAQLVKNGSADNINQMTDRLKSKKLNNLNVPANQYTLGSSTPTASIWSGGGGGMFSGDGAGSSKFNSEHGSECSCVPSESIAAGRFFKSIVTESNKRKAEIEKLTERCERLENAHKNFDNLTSTLEGERYRAEGLEEQINDLTELHQIEIETLKQTIADMEEKIQYQSDERLRDVNEVLENFQTRISKMEHMSQQQYVTVDGMDNSNARALAVKLINVVLTILQVLLLLLATAAGIIMPFFKTRVHVLTTFLTIFIIICLIRQWSDIQDIGADFVGQLKEHLVVE